MKNSSIVILAVLLSGCGIAQQIEIDKAAKQMQMREDECKEKKTNGEIRKWLDYQDCVAEPARQQTRALAPEYMDLFELSYTKQREIYEMMDKKTISVIKGQALIAEIRANITSLAVERDALMGRDQPNNFGQALGAAMSQYGQYLQQNNVGYIQPPYQTPTYTAPARPAQTNCTVTPGNATFPQSQVNCRSY